MNAAFDMSALRAVSDLYGIPYPEFNYFCTCKTATRVWPDLLRSCQEINLTSLAKYPEEILGIAGKAHT